MTDHEHSSARPHIRGLITLSPPLRLLTGVLLLAEPWPGPDEAHPPESATVPHEGRSADQHALLAADLARLRAGWMPDEACLAGAPVLGAWRLVRPDGEALPSLTGLVTGHPRFELGRRRVLTSNLAALDGASERWARTLSRWYMLGRPLATMLSS